MEVNKTSVFSQLLCLRVADATVVGLLLVARRPRVPQRPHDHVRRRRRRRLCRRRKQLETEEEVARASERCVL